MARTKFSYCLWALTEASENLFELSTDELQVFEQFARLFWQTEVKASEMRQPYLRPFYPSDCYYGVLSVGHGALSSGIRY